MYMETKRGHIRECVQVAIGRRWIVVDLDGGDWFKAFAVAGPLFASSLAVSYDVGFSTGQALDFSHFSLLLSTSYSHCKPFFLRWSRPSPLSD
jgi:hypothetical protein